MQNRLATLSDLPAYTTDGTLILQKVGSHTISIPDKHVRAARERLKRGLSHKVASPLYPISRTDAAFILAT